MSIREDNIMSFKKRLILIFLTIIILPLFLTFMALIVIGSMLNSQGMPFGNGFNFNWAIQSYGQLTEEVAVQIDEVIDTNASLLEDRSYLQELNEEVSDKNSYVVVRKDDELYYTGNEDSAKRIFERLPEYGTDREDREAGYYYDDMRKFVRQFDFAFSDGVDHFDADISEHYHVICKECGSVVDLDMKGKKIPIDTSILPYDGTITGQMIYFTGICKDCNHKDI